MPHLTILSPHLDDAALGCADHAMAWLRCGHDVSVVNVFTSFRNQDTVSPYIEPFMWKVGCDSPAAYENRRKQEDGLAMDAMGLPWENLDFIDAGFRGCPAADYRSYRELCPGRLRARELELVNRVAEVLARLSSSDAVAIPIGLGGHIDHLIVRAAAQAVWDCSRLIHYVEFPYALRPWKWNWAALRLLAESRRSVRPISPRKAEVLRGYKTQMPFLFKRPPRFPEILLSDPSGPLGNGF